MVLHAATCLTMFSLFSSESWPTLSSLNSLWEKMRSFYPLLLVVMMTMVRMATMMMTMMGMTIIRMTIMRMTMMRTATIRTWSAAGGGGKSKRVLGGWTRRADNH